MENTKQPIYAPAPETKKGSPPPPPSAPTPPLFERVLNAQVEMRYGALRAIANCCKGIAFIRGTPSSRVPAWIQKYGAALWFTYLGVALGLAASIITLEGADFWGGVHYLWLPYAVIIFGFVCYYHDALIALPVERGKKRGNPWSAAVLLYLFALVSGYPYVMLVNTLGGPHPQIVYHGAITKKWSSTPKRYSVMIQDEGSQSNYTFAVSGTYYRKCQVGQVFECRMYVGLLGIPYRWTGSP